MAKLLRRKWYHVPCVMFSIVVSGCGTVRETLPPRSAMEQMLISTAADRAIAQLPAAPFADRAVFLDVRNLECLDKAYVVQRMRSALLEHGVRLVDSRDQADVVLETASGALSINKRDALFGVPALPLPIPYAGETLKLPEVPVWKMITYRGRAKFLFSVVDARTDLQVSPVPVRYGAARDSHWWILVLGPIRHSDLPNEEK